MAVQRPAAAVRHLRWRAAMFNARSICFERPWSNDPITKAKGMMLIAAAVAAITAPALAQDASDQDGARQCALGKSILPAVQSALAKVVKENNGGSLFSPNLMWAAVVDRDGILCGTTKVGDAFPGSRAIAIAKAETGNDFSNYKLALSTAMLFVPSQPGGTLWGLNASNPFNPFFNKISVGDGPGTGVGRNPGGVITFGGGVALYKNGGVIGGLGVSGDTSCVDHVIVYRMRRLLGLDATPGGTGSDNIQYPPAGSLPSGNQHPRCSPHDLDPGQI